MIVHVVGISPDSSLGRKYLEQVTFGQTCSRMRKIILENVMLVRGMQEMTSA